MTSNCWYCRKGGLVDLYFAGRTGVCPKCGKGVNVAFDAGRFIQLDAITTGVEEWVKSTGGSGGSNEPLTMEQLKALPDGTKLYSYAKSGRGNKNNGFEGIVTVNAKEKKIIYANGGYNWFKSCAIDGTTNVYNRRLYLKELDLSADKPLTIEELMQMDGQTVWLSRFNNGVEMFSGNKFCGWHLVNAKLNKLTAKEGWDNFRNLGTPFGFNAYRTDQSHRANEEDRPWEELPF